MSKIDRRTFALGFMVMPLTGCSGSGSDSGTPAFAAAQAPASPQPVFRNYGYWRDSSVFVVTGGLKP